MWVRVGSCGGVGGAGSVVNRRSPFLKSRMVLVLCRIGISSRAKLPLLAFGDWPNSNQVAGCERRLQSG